jgi:hypothetical protein
VSAGGQRFLVLMPVEKRPAAFAAPDRGSDLAGAAEVTARRRKACLVLRFIKTHPIIKTPG